MILTNVDGDMPQGNRSTRSRSPQSLPTKPLDALKEVGRGLAQVDSEEKSETLIINGLLNLHLRQRQCPIKLLKT